MVQMKAWGKSGIVLLAALLGGCAMAPGMTMTEPAEIPGGQVVRVTPITMSLLNSLEESRQGQVRKIAREFAVQDTQYQIGPPELTIPAGSFRDAESSGQQVGDDGYLYYPYVGLVKAGGMNIAALRDVLTDKLSAYIQDPQLDVRVVGYRSKRVYVVGEVNEPGVLPLDDVPLTIADAISLSGGLTSEADKSGVNVSRDGVVHEIDLRALYDFADSSQNLMLKHGDIINVLDRSQQKVFVMGEVRNPGSVEIVNSELSLAGALGEVGGVNQLSADSGGMYVIRGTDKDQPQIFQLDASFASGLLLAERFDLQAQDVVFVDTAGISQWNRVISQLLPTISVIRYADELGTR